jgi:hypothetical protein
VLALVKVVVDGVEADITVVMVMDGDQQLLA